MKNLSLSDLKMQVPNVNPSEIVAYFLNFSTKEEYLERRAEWRALYAYLSSAIRSNKNRNRSRQSWSDRITYRIMKTGDYEKDRWGNPLVRGSEEHSSRFAMATRNVPPEMDTLGHDPTELLKVRHSMKVEAALQTAQYRDLLARV